MCFFWWPRISPGSKQAIWCHFSHLLLFWWSQIFGGCDIFHQWNMTCLEGLEILRSNEGLVLVMPAFPGVELRNAHRIRTLGWWIIFLSASFGRRFLKHSVFLFFGCQKHSPSMAFGKHNSLDGSCWWWPVFQHLNKASSPLWSQKLRIAALNQKHWKSTQDTGIAYLRGAFLRDAFLMNFTRQRVIF